MTPYSRIKNVFCLQYDRDYSRWSPARLSAWTLALALPMAPATALAAEYGVTYTGEIWSNQRGGIKRGTAWLDNLDVTLLLDTDQALGWSDTTVYGHVLYNNSTTLTDRLVGDIQGISNIDNTTMVSMLELWIEKQYAPESSVKLGLYDLNSEFDAIETAGLFINPSHGIGADYSQSGENGPSIFPVTSLAIRIQHALPTGSELRFAVLDAVPGDPDNNNYGGIKLDSDEGALLALELTHQFDHHRIGLGGWHYTRTTDTLQGASQAHNQGMYAFIDHHVPTADWIPGQLNVFLRSGMADSHINPVARYVGAGLVHTGLLSSRPQDALGFAVASVRISDDFAAQDRHETNYELTWRAPLNDHLSAQANIQYVVNPGADPALANALLFGLRLEIAL